MARRKSALIFLLLFMLLLILSPWASAPSPIAPAVRKPEGGSSAPSIPVAKVNPVKIRVAAAMEEAEFQLLQTQSIGRSYRTPDVTVDLHRVDPDKAYDQLRRESQVGEAADVMLLDSEWVKKFAASGYLLPADNAFVGGALAEQFDALSAPLKWNGYLWGVPRDFDPYVILWNLSVLHGLMGDTAAPPQGMGQWTSLAGKSRENGTAVAWLAIDGRQPFALLGWLQSVTGQRTDALWSQGANPWDGKPLAEAMSLLDRERHGVLFGRDSAEVAGMVASGITAAAVLPYSAAEKVMLPSPQMEAGDLAMDRTAWKAAYHWPRGRSFVVSSRTKTEDAARRWIALMTEASAQQENEAGFGKLPVYRSLYASGSQLALLLPGGASSASFPNQAPAEYGPQLPARLQRFGKLWADWADGGLTLADWVRRWPETSADLELND